MDKKTHGYPSQPGTQNGHHGAHPVPSGTHSSSTSTANVLYRPTGYAGLGLFVAAQVTVSNPDRKIMHPTVIVTNTSDSRGPGSRY